MSGEYSVAACSMRELAAMSVLCGTTVEQRQELEAHLASGCQECAEEIRAAGEIAADLSTAVEADPPAAIRTNLLDLVQRAPQSAGVLFRDRGLIIARSAELEWQPLGVGVDIKIIHTDTDRRYNTMLMRMAPGARYGAHAHVDVEELFVLSGDLHVAGVVMGPGDYCRADADTTHGETFSEGGCLMLVMASPDNPLIA
ncbi:MAG: cupin domain-containing protein [Acidobacteriota bacterium]